MGAVRDEQRCGPASLSPSLPIRIATWSCSCANLMPTLDQALSRYESERMVLCEAEEVA